MRRTPFSASAFSLIVVLAAAAPVLAQTTTPPSPVVIATGESRIKVAPDQAWVTVSLQTRDARGAEARRLGAAAMTIVMATLKNAGLSGDAVQTVGFSLHPEYDYANGRQRMKGMLVSNQVQVRIDDIAKVGDVLDAVGALSLPTSSTLTITGLRFDLKNRASVQRDALRLAVEDAVARAKAMATGAGMTVGRTMRIEEAGAEAVAMKFGQEQFAMARGGMADAPAPTPISPSDIEIRANVTVTVEIK